MQNLETMEPCPVDEALKIIGGKWRLQIIFQIGEETRRFGELKRLIPAISEKMLIQELKHLAKAKIVIRKAYKEIPPKVEYSLSENGKKVLPIIGHIVNFGNELLKEKLVK